MKQGVFVSQVDGRFFTPLLLGDDNPILLLGKGNAAAVDDGDNKDEEFLNPVFEGDLIVVFECSTGDCMISFEVKLENAPLVPGLQSEENFPVGLRWL
uniref:Uncharacterized protein n=1 Tax=Tetranychus urticae TaxID=32264 RepID=A0A158P571_TETUR